MTPNSDADVPRSGTGEGARPDYDTVRVFDTTLRDGEQAPGCTMTSSEKLEVAQQLARLGVDVIEAGFPAASRGDWEAVRSVAEVVGNQPNAAVICGLARANEHDIERCASAVETAARGRVHIFLATSEIHLEHKLQMTHAQVLDTAHRMVAFARSQCAEVEFSAEDAARSVPSFLQEVVAAVIEAGACVVNMPDTVGYATPDEYFDLIERVCRLAATHDHVIVSAHCHDDLGLAVANSLAGIRAGARQVECTVNGIGERAGNAALEEVVMALHTRRAFFGAATRVNTRELASASRLVARCTGTLVPPNKAVVGANAFAHEAGIHQDGVLKHRLTYEIMDAALVGADGSRLVLGRHSGRHALRHYLEQAGHALSDEELAATFTRFKSVADRKKTICEGDIEAILADVRGRRITLERRAESVA
ncbi:MAG: 2-isopropylmalate synthase [Gemmatimonadaceae bacterium]